MKRIAVALLLCTSVVSAQDAGSVSDSNANVSSAAKGDPLSQPAQFHNPPPMRGLQGWLKGPHEKGARDARLNENFSQDAPLERFQVNRDVGKFRHGQAAGCE